MFEFNQSSQQAFYFIQTFTGMTPDPGDWIVAYTPDGVTIVGAVQWAGLFNTAVPVMGDEGEDYTAGYMHQGDTPVFKLWRQSEDRLYDLDTDAWPWQQNKISPFINVSISQQQEDPTDTVVVFQLTDGHLVPYRVHPDDLIEL